MIAGILNNNIAFLIAGIMNFLTIVVFVDYLVKSDGFSSADWFAFTTYDWACILYFIFTYEGLNLSNRFKGIYWDPNVMCVYIIIALTAKIILGIIITAIIISPNIFNQSITFSINSHHHMPLSGRTTEFYLILS